MVSLWPGAVKTEFVQDSIMNAETENPMKAGFAKGRRSSLPAKPSSLLLMMRMSSGRLEGFYRQDTWQLSTVSRRMMAAFLLI